MMKIGVFHLFMPQNWQIVTEEVLDSVAEDKISTITQSTSEDIIYKSKISRLRKPIQMIKVGSFHQRIPQIWRIVTTEGLSPGRSIVHILCKPHFPDSYSLDFEMQTKI